ncbi:ATP-binding protein [Psychrobacter sp. AOP7-B1-24]|uniref:ATP-binding protein n=1 Tax=Psychrobacter sp. AOP7-B1-24 TaxID=3457645 RepID=UPI00402B22DE
MSGGVLFRFFDSLVEMTIQITENGRQVPIKTDNDLQNASSTGLSMLAVIVVFCGMTRYLCPDDGVTIHWPLDEIGKLSGKNTVLLFDLMKQYNVTLFCAQPDASPALNRFFVNKNLLDLKKGVRQFEIKRSSASNPLLANSQRLVHHQGAKSGSILPHSSTPAMEANNEPNL